MDGRLRGFQEQLAQVSSDKDHHGRQFGELVVRTQSFNKEVETCKEQLDEAKTRMKEHEARAEKKIDKVRRFNQVRLILLTEKNQAHAELDMLKDDRVRAEEKRMRQAERLGDFVRMAEQVSPERVYIPDNETYQSVEKTHAALKTQIETAQKERGMSDAQVFELAIDTKAVYDRMCRDLQAIMDVNKGLKDTLTKRLHKWRTFQRYISAHSRANFIYLLSERGFRGKLMLDHKQKRLAIQVEPDKGEKRAGGRNTKTLSGGEKSFSSICLLLSIWEAMGSPLRCLDEFDVFMDNVNRAISTNMLVSLSLSFPSFLIAFSPLPTYSPMPFGFDDAILISHILPDLRGPPFSWAAIHSHHPKRNRRTSRVRQGCHPYKVRKSWLVPAGPLFFPSPSSSPHRHPSAFELPKVC